MSKTNISESSAAATALLSFIQSRNVAGPSALTGIVSSRLTPTITYNTVNNAINPTGGNRFFFLVNFYGGPLLGPPNSGSNGFLPKFFLPVQKQRKSPGPRWSTAIP